MKYAQGKIKWTAGEHERNPMRFPLLPFEDELSVLVVQSASIPGPAGINIIDDSYLIPESSYRITLSPSAKTLKTAESSSVRICRVSFCAEFGGTKQAVLGNIGHVGTPLLSRLRSAWGVDSLRRSHFSTVCDLREVTK